ERLARTGPGRGGGGGALAIRTRARCGRPAGARQPLGAGRLPHPLTRASPRTPARARTAALPRRFAASLCRIRVCARPRLHAACACMNANRWLLVAFTDRPPRAHIGLLKTAVPSQQQETS